MSEQTINGHRIVLVTNRPDGKPTLAFITNRHGDTEDLTVTSAKHYRRLLLERLAVVDAVLAVLEPQPDRNA